MVVFVSGFHVAILCTRHLCEYKQQERRALREVLKIEAAGERECTSTLVTGEMVLCVDVAGVLGAHTGLQPLPLTVYITHALI